MKTRANHFCIFSNSGGCPQNQLDGARLVRYLMINGYSHTKNFKASDLVVINSCSYNNLKEKQSFEKTLTFYRKSREKKLIILTGCLPKIAPQLVEKLPGDIKIIPGCELNRIEEIIPPVNTGWENVRINYIPEQLFHYSKTLRRILFKFLSFLRHNLPLKAVYHSDHLLMYDHTPRSFVVEISKGCLGSCTYCVIRCSRGKLKSRPIDEIVNEIRTGIKNEVREILLTATETAAYGIDIGTSFSDLLKAIIEILKDQHLFIFYANPRWLINDWENLKPVFATRKIHFIHLSLNGGSNNVLKGMNRGYTLEEFGKLTESIKKLSPETVLQTQVITGFPGETEDDFNKTIEFFRSNYFHNVQVHPFDARPGTPAADMINQIPERIKQKRRRLLYRLTLIKKISYNAGYIFRGFKPPQFQ